MFVVTQFDIDFIQEARGQCIGTGVYGITVICIVLHRRGSFSNCQVCFFSSCSEKVLIVFLQVAKWPRELRGIDCSYSGFISFVLVVLSLEAAYL
jgi:hypothetical protein